ncbi:MAG: hypothetical protein FD127_3552 [Acidimicrobiaceae bacterium]|nr:MAG: hypothetical protein FD127_3552 [Acidimicrobiaceae bacterium]
MRLPATVVLEHVPGGAAHGQSAESDEGGGRIRCRPVQRRVWFVARAFDGHRTLRAPGLQHGHLVAGERAGLVGADERGGPQRFYGFEPADQHLSLRHLFGAPGQRQGHRGQQRLGDQRHRDADGEDESIRRGVAQSQGETEERDADPDGDCGDGAHDAGQLASQRGDGFRGRRREPGDVGQPRACAGGGDDGLCRALHDERTGEQLALAGDHGGHALTGQQRRVDEQPVVEHDPCIGGDPVARLQHQDIAVDHAGGIDENLAASTPHSDTCGQQRLQSFGGAVGAALLGKGEHCVEHHDREDGDAEGSQPGDQRKDPRDPEHGCEEVEQFADEAAQQRWAVRRRELIGTVAFEPIGRLGRAEAQSPARVRVVSHLGDGYSIAPSTTAARKVPAAGPDHRGLIALQGFPAGN